MLESVFWRYFQVKSYYEVLHSIAKLAFPWKLLWKPKVPNKLIFLWTTAWGKKLTIDEEVSNHCGRLVLHVQKGWGFHRSFTITLSCS